MRTKFDVEKIELDTKFIEEIVSLKKTHEKRIQELLDEMNSAKSREDELNSRFESDRQRYVKEYNEELARIKDERSNLEFELKKSRDEILNLESQIRESQRRFESELRESETERERQKTKIEEMRYENFLNFLRKGPKF